MKLYFVPGACSLAVNIALREAGLGFDMARVDLQTRKVGDGADFLAVNPKGYVPALQLDGGQVLTEVAAILQYVADQKPAAKLASPAGTIERYRVLEWLAFISSEIHKGFSPLFSPYANDEIRQYARDHLARRFDYLQNALKGDYLVADQFTIADAYLFTVVSWAGEIGLDMGRWPAVEQHRANIAKRPQVIAALQAEA